MVAMFNLSTVISLRLFFSVPSLWKPERAILYTVYAETFAMNVVMNHRINCKAEVEDAF
jgi:hypothetical protein